VTYAAWDGYCTAVVVIDTPTETLRVEPGPPGTAEGRFPFDDTIHIITAFNPGVRLSDSENTLRHRELGSLLEERGARFFTARGADPEWSHVEELGLDGDEDRAPRTAGQFGSARQRRRRRGPGLAVRH
jgi:hypothetical protein